MKTQNTIVLSSFILISVFAFFAASSGPGSALGIAVTTAPGENSGFCGNAECHNGGNFDQTTTISILDGAGKSVTEYDPQQKYSVRVNINAANGNPGGYGFQMVVLKDSDDTGYDGWDESSFSGVQSVTLLSRKYVEHSNPKTQSNQFSISWAAPPKGTGEVTFYAAGNAVNLNGASTGDQADTVRFTLGEAITSSVAEAFVHENDLNIYPNPTSAQLNIVTNYPIEGQLKVFNFLGQMVCSRMLTGSHSQIDLSPFKPGIYFLTLSDHEFQKISTRKVIVR